jgi:hypothetical protein
MSCIGKIQRHRRLTTSRSTARIRNSNINPFVGYAGKSRDENEITIYLNSAHRKSTEKINQFEIFIPDGPHIPVNAIVTYQIRNASIPHTFRFWRNASITLTVKTYNSAGVYQNTYVGTKVFNGVYSYDISADLIAVASWLCRETISLAAFTYTIFTYNPRITALELYASALPSGITKAEFTLSTTDVNDGLPIGFSGLTYTWVQDTAATPSLQTTEELLPYRTGPSALYMRLNETLFNVIETEDYDMKDGVQNTFEGNTAYSNILCQIPITAGYGDLLVYQPSIDKTLETQLRKEVRSIIFSLTDENENLLDCDLDWNAELRIMWKQSDFLAR